MKIGGLQKMTLLDYPGKVACTLFLSGCNLRCPYCHNPELVLGSGQGEGLPQAELLDFLEKRRGKLDGVCITGGEPTVHRDLPELIETIRSLGYLIKLDTNGSNPHMVEALLDRKLLDYVAMDIKNSREFYCRTCGGVDILQNAEKTVALLKQGTVDYEFRTTVCKPLHSVESVRQIGQWIRGAEHYYLQNFVDSGHLVGEGMTSVPPEELGAMARAARDFVPGTEIRGE